MRPGPLTDRWALVLAAAIATGAWWSAAASLWGALLAAGLALASRRPALLCLGGAMLASSLGGRALAGMPVRSGPWRGSVTLVTDAQDRFGGSEAEVRAGGHHFELEAGPGRSAALRGAEAGDRFRVDGEVSPLGSGRSYLRWRHVAGQLTASRVDRGDPPAWPWLLADRVRALIESSSASLPGQRQALFNGFVLGDARGQSTEVAADFRASGLTHLLVVSGENVALLLAVAAPGLRRLRFRGRFVATLVLLGFFAVVTRFEPSVLRAAVMAAIAASGVVLGRPTSAWRNLSLAVCVLVLVDPFLVHSIGFALSVGASAGIIALAQPLTDALPGPRLLARAAGVTLAAQVGVAPLLVSAFGGLPVATIPANVAAAPAAALVVTWGVPAGLAAAVFGGSVASIVTAPTGWLLGWLEGVARVMAGLPLGSLGPVEAGVLTVSLVLFASASHHCRAASAATSGPDRVRRDARGGGGGWSWARRVSGGLAAAGLLFPAAAVRVAPPSGMLDGGIDLVQGGGATVVVVATGASLGRSLDSLSAAGVRRLDLVVVPKGGSADGAFVVGLRHRWRVARVIGPPTEQVRGGEPVAVGQAWLVGGLRVSVLATAPRLQVTVTDRVVSRSAVRGPGGPG